LPYLQHVEDEKNIKSNTFITDKEEIVENKNGLSLPNTKLEPDIVK
jgi:hypothetical protein